MKLLRLKISGPDGFRGLPCGFEQSFRTEFGLRDELTGSEGFAPFVCAGPNGSGKSNLLEALSAIFFQMELLRVQRSFSPNALQGELLNLSPVAFELDYQIQLPQEYRRTSDQPWAKVSLRKNQDESPRLVWENRSEFGEFASELPESNQLDLLLPQYVLGYSSGENEILSLPFFKMRFVQFDEYWNALVKQLPYPGHPETRLAFIDSSFSQAILLCNLLFQDESAQQLFREDVGIESLKEFRIILRRSIDLQPEQLADFDTEDKSQRRPPGEKVSSNPALRIFKDDMEVTRYRLNLLYLLEDRKTFSKAVDALKRCATLSYLDEATDSLILDYWVNEATREAFRENFDFEANGSPIALFQAFQVLLALNLYAVGPDLKKDLYQSTSHYVNETVPVLASDQRVMRFKFLRFTKRGAVEPMMLKELSDGEHQLLHSLGLCLLFRNTDSLFLLDEPETHFNPAWRASFISRLRQCFSGDGAVPSEMLITTHSPFLISDSKPDKVLVFKKDGTSGNIEVQNPEYNTLGASINKITMSTFDTRETIGVYAQTKLNEFRERFDQGAEAGPLIDDIDRELGDSVEKLLLIQSFVDQANGARKEGEN